MDITLILKTNKYATWCAPCSLYFIRKPIAPKIFTPHSFPVCCLLSFDVMMISIQFLM